MDLLQVYIIEAHPVDEWSGGPINGVEYKQTTSLDERLQNANAFKADKNITENMVVDAMNNPCNDAYEAVATKAYVVEGGKIVWRTGMAPFQYDTLGLKDFLVSRQRIA